MGDKSARQKVAKELARTEKAVLRLNLNSDLVTIVLKLLSEPI